MRLLRLHHSSFPVRDLERARRFYEGVLGLARIPRPDLGVPGVWYGVAGGEVHLIEVPAGADVGQPPGYTNPAGRHTAFAVADYEKALARLRAAGLEVLETSAEQGQMWVRDPDGHVIELIVPRVA